MHAYKMLTSGDRVIVAVSGGVDSLVLAWVLNFWRSKAPISYDLTAVHIDMEPGDKGPGAAAVAIESTLLSHWKYSLPTGTRSMRQTTTYRRRKISASPVPGIDVGNSLGMPAITGSTRSLWGIIGMTSLRRFFSISVLQVISAPWCPDRIFLEVNWP